MSLPDIRITRYRIAPEYFRPAGRSAAWYWNYRVHCDGTCDAICQHMRAAQENRVMGAAGPYHDIGRGLADARDVARRVALRVGATWVREDWPGGNSYTLGPKGGLVKGKQHVQGV